VRLTGRRLDRLERLVPAPPPQPQSTPDWARLTVSERERIEELAAKCRLKSSGRWDLGPLTDDELDELAELVTKLDGKERPRL
jgi:hypothetical protein